MNDTLSNKNSFYYPQEVQKIPSSDQENLGLIQFDDTASVGQSKNNSMESYFLTVRVSLSVDFLKRWTNY